MFTQKQLIRIALRVREELVKLHRQRYQELLRRMNSCFSQLSEIAQISRQLTWATDRNWLAAAEHCRQQMNRDLYLVTTTVAELQRSSKTPPFVLPAPRAVYEEIQQLEEEFDGVAFDFKEGLLSVETSPVELEDVYLGAFRIELKIKDLHRHYSHGSYHVIALDPHPASGNDEVTHPHVSAERLCEGDGTAAITAALHEGRLFDFFTLVSNILHTYNPGSAYVKLESWSDSSCHECGTELSEDELYYCQACQHEYCDGCSSYCRSCDTTMCLNCLERCPVCEERVCADCLKTCKRCGAKCCLNCLDEKTCPNCQESEDQNHDSVDSDDERESETRTQGNEDGQDTGADHERESAVTSAEG